MATWWTLLGAKCTKRRKPINPGPSQMFRKDMKTGTPDRLIARRVKTLKDEGT